MYLQPDPASLPNVPRRRGDRAASIAALALCGFVGVVLGGFALMSLAFVDGCTLPDCDAQVLSRTILLTLATAAVLGAGGAVLTRVRLSRGALAWPVATATLVLVTGTFAIGMALWFQS